MRSCLEALDQLQDVQGQNPHLKEDILERRMILEKKGGEVDASVSNYDC